MEFFRKISALLEALLKASEKLSSAIRATTEEGGERRDVDNRIFAEVTLSKEAERRRSTEQEKQYRLQRWIALGTWGAFIAAGIYGAIAYQQWQEMKKQTVQSLRQMRQDGRAWIEFGVINHSESINVTLGSQLAIDIGIKNIGKTVARELRARVFFQKLAISESPPFRDPAKFASVTDTAGIAYPDTPLNFPAAWLKDNLTTKRTEPVTISGDDVRELNSGSIYFAAWGRIDYVDIYGVPHWTTFCHPYGSAALQIDTPTRECIQQYNATDDNDKMETETAQKAP